MLSLQQIDNAITSLVLQNFANIEVQESDVEEGFQRPSFFIALETNRTETFQFNRLREMTCRIHYFPSDRYVYRAEVQEVQGHLESLFGLNFSVEDRVITIDEADSNVIDKVLHYDFNFSFFDTGMPEEDGPAMEEILFG